MVVIVLGGTKMLMNNNEYLNTIESIKKEIKSAQYKAAVSVNRELIILYYNIGKIINEHKAWGNKFIDNLAADIKLEFPNVKGYSVRTLKYMAKFAETYPEEQFVQQVVAQIPWGHNVVRKRYGGRGEQAAARVFFLSIFAGFVIKYTSAPFWAVCPLGQISLEEKGR